MSVHERIELVYASCCWRWLEVYLCVLSIQDDRSRLLVSDQVAISTMNSPTIIKWPLYIAAIVSLLSTELGCIKIMPADFAKPGSICQNIVRGFSSDPAPSIKPCRGEHALRNHTAKYLLRIEVTDAEPLSAGKCVDCLRQR